MRADRCLVHPRHESRTTRRTNRARVERQLVTQSIDCKLIDMGSRDQWRTVTAEIRSHILRHDPKNVGGSNLLIGTNIVDGANGCHGKGKEQKWTSIHGSVTKSVAMLHATLWYPLYARPHDEFYFTTGVAPSHSHVAPFTAHRRGTPSRPALNHRRRQRIRRYENRDIPGTIHSRISVQPFRRPIRGLDEEVQVSPVHPQHAPGSGYTWRIGLHMQTFYQTLSYAWRSRPIFRPLAER